MGLNECGILISERSAHPVLLHCLQDFKHEWRRLQLVNKSMAAAFQALTHKSSIHLVAVRSVVSEMLRIKEVIS